MQAGMTGVTTESLKMVSNDFNDKYAGPESHDRRGWERNEMTLWPAEVQPQQSPGGPEGAIRRRRWETDDITPQRTVKLCSVYCKHKWIFIFSFLA